MQQRSSFAYAGLVLLWGVSFVSIRWVVGGFGWAPAVSLSCLLIGLTVAVLAVLNGRRLDLRLRWRRMLLLGFGLAVQLIGLTLAVDRLGTALAAVAVGTVPLFSTLIGQMWGFERITGQAAIGLVLGFVGILLVLMFPAEGISWDFIAGMFAGLLSAIAGALVSRYAVARLSSTGPAELVSAAFLTAAVLTAPLAWLFPGPGGPGLLDWLGVVVLGILLGGLGFTLEVSLRGSAGTPVASSARSGATIAAVLIGMVFLREMLSGGQYFGVLLLVGGCALVLGLPQLSRFTRRR